MGYSTNFTGSFAVTPVLSEEHAAYLARFSETRRMKRNAEIAEKLNDPWREAVGLPIGDEGAYFTGGAGSFGQDKDLSVINSNDPPEEQPGLWCQWVPSKDNTQLEWDGGEKFYDYTDWLEYLIDNFLKPWGYTLNGSVNWIGEESDDRGTITVKDNVVTANRTEILGIEEFSVPEVSRRQFATILVGLRMIQEQAQNSGIPVESLLAQTDHFKVDGLTPLTTEEIDNLADHLNSVIN
jgi:hypothetical protein